MQETFGAVLEFSTSQLAQLQQPEIEAKAKCFYFQWLITFSYAPQIAISNICGILIDTPVANRF